MQRLVAERDRATSAQAKQLIDQQIAVQKARETGQATQIAGLQCLGVAVPSDTLAVWQGGTP